MRTSGGRRGLAAVALVCHLLTAFGFPVPTSSRKTGGTPFPCQTHPCGCLTADECWKGDCCCFTIEEKLHWAEANGIEPPAHVRPLVESRKSKPIPPLKKKSCCSGRAPEQSAESTPTCLQSFKQSPTNCTEKVPHHAAANCPQCDTAAEPEPAHQYMAPDRSGVRWVAGMYAQKCRGQGPAGLFLFDPAVLPVPPVALDPVDRDRHPAPRSVRVAPSSHIPPTRPPRDLITSC